MTQKIQGWKSLPDNIDLIPKIHKNTPAAGRINPSKGSPAGFSVEEGIYWIQITHEVHSDFFDIDISMDGGLTEAIRIASPAIDLTTDRDVFLAQMYIRIMEPGTLTFTVASNAPAGANMVVFLNKIDR